MSPSELIHFFVIGVAVVIAITILLFIFRKKRRTYFAI